MWEPRRLKTVWDFKTCYSDSFTFIIIMYEYIYKKEAVDFIAGSHVTPVLTTSLKFC
jgi:hypothetical protein